MKNLALKEKRNQRLQEKENFKYIIAKSENLLAIFFVYFAKKS